MHRPSFNGFGHQRVIRVRKAMNSDVPRIVPCEMFIVEKEAHQLWDGQRRVCIIQLNGNLTA